MPVVLWCPDASPEAVHLAPDLARLGVRAVILRDEATYEALRPLLTRHEGLGEEVVEWLSLHGIDPPFSVSSAIAQMFDCGLLYTRVSEVLEDRCEVGTTVRRRFRAAGLPPPHLWLRAARALQTALRLQRQPEIPLLPLALELGYADHSALSLVLHRAFHIRPGQVRGTLGWEWLLARWLDPFRPGV
jgi:AraC-like DNA-binding protein